MTDRYDSPADELQADSAEQPVSGRDLDPSEPAGELGIPGFDHSAVSTEEAREGEEPARPGSVKGALEAVLMVTDQPLDHLSLAQAVASPPAVVLTALQELAAEYTEQERGFDLRQVGDGWRFYSRDTYFSVVERFVLDGQQTRLTRAALETLAVVAYRQPVTRGRISAIRGVNVDAVMRTLVTRGLVEETGAESDTGAHLYRTTTYFLERLGLQSIDQLPEIAPFLPEMADLPELDDEGALSDVGTDA